MKCETCTDDFIPRSTRSRYCSNTCRHKAQNDKQKGYKQRRYLASVGRTELMERTSKGRWIHSKYGYVMIKHKGELVYEHRMLAEKALGKPLPPKAIVHHMVAPDDNHGFLKLVICPDQEYHMLLHKRMEELGYAHNQD